jgi:Ca2+-binding RTX toxin-like protein
VIDPENEIEEWDEGGNVVKFAGGTFYSPTTKRLYTQDTDANGTDILAPVHLTLQQFQNGIAIPQYALDWDFYPTVGLENVVGLTLYTHGGDDTVTFDPTQLPWALPLVWYAGPGNETFNGTALADEFHGGAGNDTAYGLAGADVLFGGEGDDLIYGGAGNDTLEGGDGYDRLYGEDGATTVRVGPESTDSIFDDVYAEWGAGDSTAIDWQGGRSGIKAILSDRTLNVLGSGSGHMDIVQDGGRLVDEAQRNRHARLACAVCQPSGAVDVGSGHDAVDGEPEDRRLPVANDHGGRRIAAGGAHVAEFE